VQVYSLSFVLLCVISCIFNIMASPFIFIPRRQLTDYLYFLRISLHCYLIGYCRLVKSAHSYRTLLFTAFNHLYITFHIQSDLCEQIDSYQKLLHVLCISFSVRVHTNKLDVIRNTFDNMSLLKRIRKVKSEYSRSDMLNDWEVGPIHDAI